MNDRLQPRHRADLAMVGVSLLWGITFPLIRTAVEELSPYSFVAYRFGLATLAFLPLVVLSQGARRGIRAALWPGLYLGALAWASYLAQTIGLQTVPAGRAAFITGTSVIMVPLLSPLFAAGRPARVDLVAALIALSGLYLLTSAPGTFSISPGDLWVLACAALYAVYIHALQKVLRRPLHGTSLAFVQVAAIAACGWVVVPWKGLQGLGTISSDTWTALVVCALLATVGTFWLQTRFQRQTTPERVALIFSLEPVFATLFSYWLLGETLTKLGALGAALILLAVIGVEWWARRGDTD